jgi:hypothetical protein
MSVARSPERTEELLGILGDPKAVARDLREFKRTAKVLSSNTPRLIDQYPKQWVAIYKAKVQAHAGTLQSLLVQVEDKGLPRGKMIVRYIDRTQRTMIL